MGGIFITGTDTGVGKTFVACGLIKGFREMGLRVVPFKPVETGCPDYPMDGRALIEASGIDLSYDLVVPYLFREPLAPSVAARLEGRQIDLCFIKERFKKLESMGDLVVVEGAGGLLVPIAGRFTYADLAVFLDLPLIVVARSKLGTINHTLLTLRVARAYGLKVLGVVLNMYEGADTAERTNPDVIKELGGCEVYLVERCDEVPTLKRLAEAVYEGLGRISS